MPLDHVIGALGTNDLKKKYGPPSAEEVALGIERIVERIVGHNFSIEPVLLTPPRLGEVNAGDLAGAQRIMPTVATNYHLVAARQHIPIIDIHSTIDIDTDLELDLVHLNAVGRKKVARSVWIHLGLLRCIMS